ncbi:hypothetical protein B566_EDAN017215 [Ephemera danica]|nr:hypothetical protein B566_EDAN017215 [Ephemera danica]
MSNSPKVACIIKIIKLVINLAVLILYRIGDNGKFLGVGGTWNLNEEKNPDSEIVASGIFVGYFIYTSLAVMSFVLESMRGKRRYAVKSYDELPNDNSIVVVR